MSAVVPGRTRLAALRDVTLAIVLSAHAHGERQRLLRVGEDGDAGVGERLVAVFCSESVYSSGASETKAKCPRASVVVARRLRRARTVTFAPGIGAAPPSLGDDAADAAGRSGPRAGVNRDAENQQ